MSGLPGIRVTGLSHHTAPLELRERLTLPISEYGPLVRQIVNEDGWLEGVVISTCNRTELIAVTSAAGASIRHEAFSRFLSGRAGESIDRYLYRFESAAAVEHLFRVAASLDSLVLGEAQILGQINEAFGSAAEAGTVGPILDRLFSRARQAAKRVRHETGIGEGHVSLASVAVELAEKIFGRLAGRSAMVIGAGDIALLTLRHLAAAGVRRVSVTNRTGERAIDLAARMGGVPIDFERRFDALTDVDIVLSTTASPAPIMTRTDLAPVMARRRHRPIFLIDLALPRDIDPAVADLENVFLYNIDDLGNVVERNRSERRGEADRARVIVADEAGRFVDWLATQHAVPTVVALRERLDSIRLVEENRLLDRLGHLSERDKEAVRAFAGNLVGKILHEPSVRLRDARDPRETARLIEAARLLFALDESNDGDQSNGHDRRND
ncbi:MAG: glutamyl-tRNA reductase [Candidatus Eisenbacteria bacterium]|nr:glutamyl-tRNA reductase [Candidatus Eisenbacteria bacterium]